MMKGSRKWLYYVSTGLLISGLAFVNQYPLVYADTGAYLATSYDLAPLDDRPIGYGLMLRAFSWQSTLWPMIVFQGAVTSWLLMLLVRAMSPMRYDQTTVHLGLIALLVVGSSMPWYTAQIMADCITPLVLLISFLLFRTHDLGRARYMALYLLLFFFMATHNAHFPMCFLLSIALALRHMLKRQRSLEFWRTWGVYNSVLVASAIMVATFHYVHSGTFQMSKASNVFLVGRLCEPGIIADHLNAECRQGDHRYCEFKKTLPLDAGDLLWSKGQYLATQGLSISQADTFFAPLVTDVLGKPTYLARFARSSLTSTMVMLFQWDAGSGLHGYGEGSSTRNHMIGKMDDELYRYDHSRQNSGYFEKPDSAVYTSFLVMAAAILIFMLLWFRPHSPFYAQVLSITRWVAFWVVVNAFVVATLAVVDSRLQSRVMWLLPMAAYMVIVQSGGIRGFLINNHDTLVQDPVTSVRP